MKLSGLLLLVVPALCARHEHKKRNALTTVLVTETTVVWVDDHGSTQTVAPVINVVQTDGASSAVTSLDASSQTSVSLVNEYEVSGSAVASSDVTADVTSSASSAGSSGVSSSADFYSSSPESYSTSSASFTSSASSSSSASASPSSLSSGSSSGSSGSSSIYGDLLAFSNPTEKFEDGVHDCSSVPTGQGVIALPWVGYDGWASILNEAGNTSPTCKEGFYCSYACQAGMSKTQWPSDQLSDGQTRGGLICKNGKLYRTNKNTDYLCEWGANTANAVSKIDKVVSLCRTDYPGSENMVVPTRLEPGQSQPISVVVSESYFKWQGKPTSAQYYVNDAGIDVEEGCIWGTSSGTVGNWAPVVIGSGQTNGITYLSLIPNPNNRSPPSYNLKIEGSQGSSTVGTCYYENGSYSGSGSDGCTLSVTKGSANFVFY